MNKQAVILQYHQLVNELGEEPHDVVLSAGSALVMMGVREETTDLDVDVNEGVFKMYLRKSGIALDAVPGLGECVAYSDTIDLHQRNEDVGVVCIEGVWVYSPSAMLMQKRFLVSHPKRKPEKIPQDLADIAKLEELVRSQKLTARVVA